MNWIAQKCGPRIGTVSNWRGFLAAGAENMTLDNATKEFTIDDQIKLLQNKIDAIKVGPKNETSNQ